MEKVYKKQDNACDSQFLLARDEIWWLPNNVALIEVLR